MKDRNLFGARGARSSSSRALPCSSRSTTTRRHDLVDVAPRLGDRVDPIDSQARTSPIKDVCDRWAAGSVVLRWTAWPRSGETDSERRGYGRLADATLPHDHDQPAPGAGEVVDEPVEARQVRRDIRPRILPLLRRHLADRQQDAKRLKPDHVVALQRHFVLRQTCELRRHGR